MKTMMKKLGWINFFQFLCFATMLQATSLPMNGPAPLKGLELTFTENKCLIKEFSGNVNTKILFIAQAENTRFFFKKDGINLQLNSFEIKKNKSLVENQASMPITRSIQNIELNWEGMNKNVSVYGGEEINSLAFRNHINTTEKDCEIKNYRKLYYTQMYPGVDMRYYDHDNRLKYDVIVQPGFDYKEIGLKIDGIDLMYLNAKGQVVMITNSGELIQEKPLVLQNGKPLVAKWVLNNKSIRLDITNMNPDLELMIQTSIYNSGNSEYKM